MVKVHVHLYDPFSFELLLQKKILRDSIIIVKLNTLLLLIGLLVHHLFFSPDTLGLF